MDTCLNIQGHLGLQYSIHTYTIHIFMYFLHIYLFSRGRVLGRNWDKVSRVFLFAIHSNLCYRILPPNSSKMWVETGLECKQFIYGDLKSENSQDNVQKPQRNCTFMNSVSAFFCRQQSTISVHYLCIKAASIPQGIH